MPPTGNHDKIARNTRNGARLFKSPERRRFDQEVSIWILRNTHKLQRMNEEILKVLKQGYQLKPMLYFCFPREKLWTKQNEPKQIDVDNRIKSTIDGIANALKINDKHFWSSEYEKVECEDLEAHVMAAIGTFKPQKKENLWIMGDLSPNVPPSVQPKLPQ